MDEELASRGPIWIIENQCDVQRILGDADAIVKSLAEQVVIHFHQTDAFAVLPVFNVDVSELHNSDLYCLRTPCPEETAFGGLLLRRSGSQLD